MKITDLRPFAKRIDLIVKLMSKGEIREVTAKASGEQHRVTEALVGDASGTVLLTLWDDTIESIEEGKSYKITNGYVTTFKNSIRLNVGKYGKIEESEQEVGEINEGEKMSERQFEQRMGY